ncbi:ABC transporter ATP-binding protein [Anaeropeptidivorans aminofermentans]|jgi:ATP-binding cassette subfamily B protein|uniref:ABC transporter ATP-binding protein n=1 Tax=Anaeropeptidivorans aminofermentans TaxID=2934315 RepID=UPI0020256171|nr:ABC transporter ATP-binding protein [Anaeropeptidivorans aminofermentans]
MIKTLLPYLKKYKLFAILAPLTVILEVLLEVSIPRIMAGIIDIGIAQQDMNYIVKMGMLMILMAILSLVFGGLSARFAAVAGTGFSKEVRKAIFGKIQDFSFSNIDKFSTASLITRITTDTNNTQNAVMISLRLLVRAPIMFICAIFMAFSINSSLTFIFAIAVPILIISLVLIIKNAFVRFQKMLKQYDNLNSTVQENIIGIRTVKAFVRETFENEKFRKIAGNVRDAQASAERVLNFMMPTMQFVMYGCMIAIFWFGGNMIILGNMLTGELMSFISYVTQILMSLMMLSMAFVQLSISRASVERIAEVINEEPEIRNNNSPLKNIPNGSVEFENAYFSYNENAEEYILEDINIHINSGESIGIIGGTGSGKTTLVQLIPRLYDVHKGKVKVGGIDVKDYDLEALRESVSMVLQKNVLFSGTIKENLRWGDKNATDEEIIEACKAAQAHDFIMSFPNGYDTWIEQGGVNLSGGQKQRLCIARALIKKPKIIILDDSTSAVDTATDSAIRAALRKNLRDMTSIIIAQRISSIMDCDKIFVMNDGKIETEGNHETLMEKSEVYREIYHSQMKEEA